MAASLVYLIDNTLDGKGPSPRELRAALGRVREGLEILIEPYHAVSLERVESVHPSHIILSGQSHPWDRYSPEKLAGVVEVIKKASLPTLGVCGGHQQIALAFGAAVDLMGRLEPGEVSVAVAVSTPHRDDAFAAGRWLIDTIKNEIPIWKRENWTDGSAEWLHPTAEGRKQKWSCKWKEEYS